MRAAGMLNDLWLYIITENTRAKVGYFLFARIVSRRRAEAVLEGRLRHLLIAVKEE